MKIKIVDPSQGGGTVYALVCPHCGHHGAFERIPNVSDVFASQHWLGQRYCPNPKCRNHIFFIATSQSEVIRTYPPLCLNFDVDGIPDRVRKSLAEAITCHAEECYTAAAIMVRRCLEELCEDRGAKGNTLKDRIAALQSSVVLPKELFQAMEELRILGNDAAHLEAKAYDQIGKQEVEVAIELVKEILKAIFQLDGIVKKLQGLRKS